MEDPVTIDNLKVPARDTQIILAEIKDPQTDEYRFLADLVELDRAKVFDEDQDTLREVRDLAQKNSKIWPTVLRNCEMHQILNDRYRNENPSSDLAIEDPDIRAKYDAIKGMTLMVKNDLRLVYLVGMLNPDVKGAKPEIHTALSRYATTYGVVDELKKYEEKAAEEAQQNKPVPPEPPTPPQPPEDENDGEEPLKPLDELTDEEIEEAQREFSQTVTTYERASIQIGGDLDKQPRDQEGFLLFSNLSFWMVNVHKQTINDLDFEGNEAEFIEDKKAEFIEKTIPRLIYQGILDPEGEEIAKLKSLITKEEFDIINKSTGQLFEIYGG